MKLRRFRSVGLVVTLLMALLFTSCAVHPIGPRPSRRPPHEVPPPPGYGPQRPGPQKPGKPGKPKKPKKPKKQKPPTPPRRYDDPRF